MRIHVVQKGDTLWKIAKQYGIGFEEIKRLNAHLANPDYIVPGMEIILPDNPSVKGHMGRDPMGGEHMGSGREHHQGMEHHREREHMGKEHMTAPMKSHIVPKIKEELTRPKIEVIPQPMPMPTPMPMPQQQQQQQQQQQMPQPRPMPELPKEKMKQMPMPELPKEKVMPKEELPKEKVVPMHQILQPKTEMKPEFHFAPQLHHYPQPQVQPQLMPQPQPIFIEMPQQQQQQQQQQMLQPQPIFIEMPQQPTPQPQPIFIEMPQQPMPQPQPIFIEMPQPQVQTVVEKEIEYVPVPHPQYIFVPCMPRHHHMHKPMPCKCHKPRCGCHKRKLPCGCGSQEMPSFEEFNPCDPAMMPFEGAHYMENSMPFEGAHYMENMMPFEGAHYMETPMPYEGAHYMESPNEEEISPEMDLSHSDVDASLPDWLADSSSSPGVMGVSEMKVGAEQAGYPRKESQLAEYYDQMNQHEQVAGMSQQPFYGEHEMMEQHMPHMMYQQMPEMMHYNQSPMMEYQTPYMMPEMMQQYGSRCSKCNPYPQHYAPWTY